MNREFFTLIDESFFSDDTYKNEHDSDSKANSFQHSNLENLPINCPANYICQNITLNVSQNKKNSASLSLNLGNGQNRTNHSHINIYTQNIILHSLNKIKNTNSFHNNENENINKEIQHIILKSLKKNKEENIKKSNNDKNENFNKVILNTNDIIRVIVSNEKILKNFPIEYLNEMIYDICINLYNDKYNSEKLKSKQSYYYNNYQNYFETRSSLFNFILQLTMNTSISEATLFLIYNIFDRYISIQSENINHKDELLLIIITCFVLAIKYNETRVPNLEELCLICQNKFNKEQINKYELNIMESLNYNISLPTIFDLFQFIRVIKNLTQKEYYLGLLILEMFIISGGALKYNPLNIIEAIYLLVLETIGKEKRNLNLYNFVDYYSINLIIYNEETEKCLLDIKDECMHIKEKNFTNLIKKFASDKYQGISFDFHLL